MFIETKFNKDIIESSMISDDSITKVSRQLIQLQEGSIKEALHKLGYLNPEETDEIKRENEKLREALSDLIDGYAVHDLVNGHGFSEERAIEIFNMINVGDK